MSPGPEDVTPRELGPADVEIVVVPRERYEPTADTLEALVATVPASVPIVLVRGGMPDRLVARLRARHGDRVRIIGPTRHLTSNAARSIGLAAATARYVVFADNDIEPSPGWLEALVATAEEHDAWVVRPLVLQRMPDGRTLVHDAGGDCHLERNGDVVTLVETHLHLGAPLEAVEGLVAQPVEMLEFHAALFDRERLVALGGPDERVRSVGDHLDLALRVRDAGGSLWLAPGSVVTYRIPARVALRDLPFYLVRWSPAWTAKSRAVFREDHGVNDPADPHETWLFADLHRAHAWLPLGRLVAAITRRPVARGVSRRFDRYVGRHVVRLVHVAAPRWRGDGVASI